MAKVYGTNEAKVGCHSNSQCGLGWSIQVQYEDGWLNSLEATTSLLVPSLDDFSCKLYSHYVQ